MFHGPRRTVDLGRVVLRRVEFGGSGWNNRPVGLESALREYVGRRGTGSGLADLLGSSAVDSRDSGAVVARICALVEAGRIQVEWRDSGFGGHASASPEPVPLASLEGEPETLAEAPPEPVGESTDPDPHPETTAAQARALVNAARAGTPFCEVCAPAPKTAPVDEKQAAAEAAQVEALTLAAEEGTAFCEVCSAP
ncbi:MAG: hypothetical protein ACRBN8_17445 [Nannocystales bacterium]